MKQLLAAAAGTAIAAAVGGEAGAASGFNATVNNYLTAADLRSKHQKLSDCRAKNDPACEIRVLKEYEAKNAKNTANINYNSILTEDALRAEKAQLELLLTDDDLSSAAKAEARRSIKELDKAINVIQRSPALQDAAELGLIALDVVTLGQLAAAKVLTAVVVREIVLSRTGREITEFEAARIANNFYRDGVSSPQAIATSSGHIISANPTKTTTVLGTWIDDTDNILNAQLGYPKTENYLSPKIGGFNLLNTPNELYASLGPSEFWEKVNKPFLEAAINRGDDIYLATNPTNDILTRSGGFRQEVEFLQNHGYYYDSLSGKMIKRQ